MRRCLCALAPIRRSLAHRNARVAMAVPEMRETELDIDEELRAACTFLGRSKAEVAHLTAVSPVCALEIERETVRAAIIKLASQRRLHELHQQRSAEVAELRRELVAAEAELMSLVREHNASVCTPMESIISATPAKPQKRERRPRSRYQ